LENGKFTNNLAWPSAVANCKKVKIRNSKKAMELWGCSAAKYELQTQTTRGDIREHNMAKSVWLSQMQQPSVVPVSVSVTCALSVSIQLWSVSYFPRAKICWNFVCA